MDVQNSEEFKEYLKALLEYCPETGSLTWKYMDWDGLSRYYHNTVLAGQSAENLTSNGGYPALSVRYLNLDFKLMSHRVAWLLYYGDWPLSDIDHIDGNPCNNSINNLRDVVRSLNQRNRSIDSRNKSGYSGILKTRTSKNKDRWVVQVTIKGNGSRHVGTFKSKEDAIKAFTEFKRDNNFTEDHGIRKLHDTDVKYRAKVDNLLDYMRSEKEIASIFEIAIDFD